ncbi:MAG: DUF1573 domain-containing protein [Candidatus Omnitrophota bacterium]
MIKRLLFTFLVCLQSSVCWGLAFDSDLWDFGQVREGQVARHVFVLKNDSTEVLHIKNVLPACGCIKAEIDKESFGPGEEARLEVSFDSRGYSADVQQFIFLNTDNKDKPVFKFTVKAYVIK